MPNASWFLLHFCNALHNVLKQGTQSLLQMGIRRTYRYFGRKDIPYDCHELADFLARLLNATIIRRMYPGA
jgi:hypothetical protein